MKAIETVYNGYRFRSRTEARWAVFFDTAGIPWEYEKEGYELDGIRYLPDFWLPEQDHWVEIKWQQPTEEENQKAERLVLATKKPVFILWGGMEPARLEYVKTLSDREWFRLLMAGRYQNGIHLRFHGAFGHKLSTREDGVVHLSDAFWWFAECPKCYRLELTFYGQLDGLSCGHNQGSDQDNHASPRLRAAYTAACQADFDRNGLKRRL